MIAVYTTGYTINLNAFSRLVTKQKFKIFTNFDEFIACPVTDKNRVAVFEYPYWGHGHNEFIQKVHQAVNNHVEHVIVRTVELHSNQLPLFKKLDHPRITIYAGGVVNSYQFKHASFITDPYWLYDTSRIYMDKPELFQTKFDPYSPKEYFFDAMYGSPKPYRRATRTYINQSPLSNYFLQADFLKIYSTYASTVQTNSVWWEDEIKYDDPMGHVDYFGYTMLPSQVIPFKVYSRAAYSLVPETNVENNHSFFTEKIAKPIIAKRLFIAISGKHYLKNLRQLGFETFGHIVDESYDEIDDPTDRRVAAINAAFELTKLPQATVLDSCKDIFEHNHSRMKEIYLTQSYRMVEQHIEKLIHLADKSD